MESSTIDGLPDGDEQQPSKFDKDFFTFAFERAEYEHDQLHDVWKLIDTKAQGTATIAGIFMAAAFAYVRNAGFTLNNFEKLALVIVVAALVVAIAYAVVAMLVRETPLPITGGGAEAIVASILSRPEKEHQERYSRMLADTVREWVVVNGKIRDESGRKANFLQLAQCFLLAAAGATALLTFAALLHKP